MLALRINWETPARRKDRTQLRHTHGAANIVVVARHPVLSRGRHQGQNMDWGIGMTGNRRIFKV